MLKRKRVLLLIETSRAYGRKIIEGISQYVLEHDCWEIDIEDRGVSEDIPVWVRRWKGDGIIARTATPSRSEVLSRLGIPIVELLGDAQKSNAEVYTDEAAIGRMACEHFLERGLLHFAYFSFGNAWWAKLRCDAFVHSLALFGHSCHIYPGIRTGRPTAHPIWNDKHEQPLKQWLKKLPRPIGIFGTNDLQALHLLHACRNGGFSIPDEVAVLGAGNDTMLCNLQTPSLSSIDLNAQKIGYVAAEILSKKMDRKPGKPNTPIVIPPLNVVLRKSTDIIAVDDPDIVTAIRFIRNRALEGIKVSDVVEATDLSYATLLRRFRRIVGRTPEEEITRLRIERAKYLLRKTRLSTASIGKRVGFHHPEHFARVFRSLENMSPMEYRKRLVSLPEK